jgi:drug/metabolite transporter (DMT)-like permease
MVWQLLLIGYLILETAAYILRKRLAVALTKHNRLVHAFFSLCVLYPTGLVLAFLSQANLNIGWQNLLFVLAGSVMFPVFNLLAFKANKTVDAGLYTILFNLTPVVTIAAATFLLNEGLDGGQLTGAAIIIGSAFLATLPKIFKRSVTKTAGIGVALASIAIIGMAIVFERWMLTRMDLGAYLVYGWGAQTLWTVAMAWPDRRHVRACSLFRGRPLRFVLGYSGAITFKSVFFIAALKFSGSASLVVAFASFTSVLVVLAAYFMLKERDHLRYKVGAAAVGVTGLIILNT